MSQAIEDIVNVPSKWPASFPHPDTGTRVLTYVFNSKDEAKVEKLLNFIKDTAPKAKVSVTKDKNGYTSVTITQTPTNATAACACWTSAGCGCNTQKTCQGMGSAC